MKSNTKRWNVKLDNETYRAMTRMAKEEGRSHTEVMRRAVLAREIHVKSRTSESLDVRGKKEGVGE